MTRRNRRRVLDVAMNGIHVGTWELASHGVDRFEYCESWLELAAAIPLSLSLPLSARPYTGNVVGNYFDNLLPDNRHIRERLEAKLGARSGRPFDLLESIGADCVGALQLFEPESNPPNPRRVLADPVSDADIALTLRDYQRAPLGMRPDGEFRISIAGAQEKTAWLRHHGAWHRPRRATPTSHIFKLPIGPAPSGIDLTDSVENEWLCLRIASAFGLPVPDASIQTFEDEKVLVVERFDRQWSPDQSWLVRLPQEDMCQAHGLSPARKYEADGGPGIPAIMELLFQTMDPTADRARFFRTQVLFWLLAAIDGHAKNFSVFLMAGGRCRLTPIYDVLSAHPIVASGQLHERQLKMAMAVTGKNRHYRWNHIEPRHWLSTARAARLPEAEAREVLEQFADEGRGVLDGVRASLPPDFPDHVADPILDGALRRLER